MALYIYNQDTYEIHTVISGENSNKEAESKAAELELDQDLYAWSYTKGVNLIETNNTKYINLGQS